MKIGKGYFLSFLLGAILFSGVTYAVTISAVNVSYDNTRSNINATNVNDAIDALYTKANEGGPESYTGLYTYTPNTTTQTVYTANKLLNNNITINAIPSSYKNLTANTTATADKILNGYTAYNKDGQLVTGSYTNTSTKGTEWNYGSFTSISGENTVNIGFIPNRIVLLNNSNGISIIYDKEKSQSTFMVSYSSDRKVEEVNISASLTSTGIRSLGANTKIYLITSGNKWTWFATK